MHPLLNKISDELDPAKDKDDVPFAVHMNATGYTVVLRAMFPGPADRAIFFIDPDDDSLLHVAVARDWHHNALDTGQPVDEISTLPPVLTDWTPRYLEPQSWRTVRLSPSQLVTLVDIPIEPHVPLNALLDDLRVATENQGLAGHADVHGHSGEDDPFAPFLHDLDFGPGGLRMHFRGRPVRRPGVAAGSQEVEAR